MKSLIITLLIFFFQLTFSQSYEENRFSDITEESETSPAGATNPGEEVSINENIWVLMTIALGSLIYYRRQFNISK